MPIEDTVYYDSDGKKFQLYINGSYQTIGAVHLDAINTENNKLFKFIVLKDINNFFFTF